VEGFSLKIEMGLRKIKAKNISSLFLYQCEIPIVHTIV